MDVDARHKRLDRWLTWLVAILAVNAAIQTARAVYFVGIIVGWRSK